MIKVPSGAYRGSDTVTHDSFLEAVFRISACRAPSVFPAQTSGSLIASRYRLQAELGRGGHGVVWSAVDTVVKELVAVKLIRPLSEEHGARIRTEIASLRRLRIRGVVRLIDEGLSEDCVFLVMPLIRGSSFPGAPRALSWTEIEQPASRLLETMARVHAAGIVHRDLKPENILLDEEGRPTVLDFGLSTISAFESPSHTSGILGTPFYLAPEQVTGVGVDSRADLYAIGVMLYRALSGSYPHAQRNLQRLLRAKREPHRPLGALVPRVPRRVANMVDALLATNPEDRPESALIALNHLDGRNRGVIKNAVVPDLLKTSSEALSIEEVQQLFGGLDRLTWVREDAARLLHERTGGRPEHIDTTIQAWVRAGRCRWDSGTSSKLIIERNEIDELESGLWNQSSSSDSSHVENAMLHAHKLAEEGRLGNAVVAVQEALVALRLRPTKKIESVGRVLSLWTDLALAQATPQSLDRILYEICREGRISDLVVQLEHLVRAGLSVGAWNAQASTLAESVPPFDNPSLEVRRLAVRVQAARRGPLELEEAVVSRVVDDANRSPDPRLVASAAGWLGKLRYRQGRYAEAAELHTRCAVGPLWRTERAAAMLHASSATLEAFRNQKALDIARAALFEARQCRDSYLAGRAEWLIRSALYRMGVDRGVDKELLEAARAQPAPDVFGIISLVETAHAYRAKDSYTNDLAREAYDWWLAAGEPVASLLAGSLTAATAGWSGSNHKSALSVAARRRLRQSAWSCEVPGIGIQCAALLKQGGMAAPAPALCLRLAATVPRKLWRKRMDILSVKESMDILNA